MLRSVREHFIAFWHFHNLDRRTQGSSTHASEVFHHHDEAMAALNELRRLRVLAYRSPVRGIALIPFLVQLSDGHISREAFFVYKDSRAEIDTFAFSEDVFTDDPLDQWGRPVPESWKIPGAIPRLDEEETA